MHMDIHIEIDHTNEIINRYKNRLDQYYSFMINKQSTFHTYVSATEYIISIVQNKYSMHDWSTLFQIHVYQQLF